MNIKKTIVALVVFFSLCLSFSHVHAISEIQDHEPCSICHHQGSLITSTTTALLDPPILQTETVSIFHYSLTQKSLYFLKGRRAPPLFLL